MIIMTVIIMIPETNSNFPAPTGRPCLKSPNDNVDINNNYNDNDNDYYDTSIYTSP